MRTSYAKTFVYPNSGEGKPQILLNKTGEKKNRRRNINDKVFRAHVTTLTRNQVNKIIPPITS